MLFGGQADRRVGGVLVLFDCSQEPSSNGDDAAVGGPEVLSAPYTYSQAYDKQADWQIREYVCDENNRDSADAEGRAHLDLGLDDQGDPFGPPADDQGQTKAK